MNKTLLSLALAVAAPVVFAKLPPLDDAAKAKAAEAAAKAAWQGKLDAYQLCRAQDKVAAKYGSKGKAGATKTAAAPASAASGATTPVAYAPPPPCADPGPFAYNQPDQKPLETSGAHSPAGNATSPPSVRAESATMRKK